MSSTERTPPPTVSGMNTSRAVRSTTVEERAATLGRGGDVEEDQLVGALGGVPCRELGRIPLVDEVHEAGALHDPAIGHVETGDDPAPKHQRSPAVARRKQRTPRTARRIARRSDVSPSG